MAVCNVNRSSPLQGARNVMVRRRLSEYPTVEASLALTKTVFGIGPPYKSSETQQVFMVGGIKQTISD
jgi:hypothetical protein